MNALKTLRYATAALALGSLGAAVAPVVQAVGIADYAADALVQVTLTAVRDGSLGADVTITYESSIDIQSASSTGLTSYAVADPYTWPDSARSMGLNDRLDLDHSTLGEAGAPGGHVFSEIRSSGYISMTNNSANPVELDFEIHIDPLATGTAVNLSGNPAFADAFANVTIELFDFRNLSVLKELNASLASGVVSETPEQLLETYTVTLAPGESNDISVLVSTSGGATLFVPEPTTFALFAVGLIGFATHRCRAAR